MLKRQTVWLLTMLSLVVVLSVYYVTAPKDTNDHIAFMNNENVAKQQADDKEKADVAVEEMETKGGNVASSESSDDVFTALRMQIEDERSRLRDQLNDIVASANATAQQKSDALDKIEKLEALAEKEATLETLIKSKGGYDDVLVRADDDKVRVTIKAKNHSAKSANDVIHIVKSEIPEVDVVNVEFQPAG
ncbi:MULTISPECIES: SpoIIIAH-like family protein [Parageobacillus]|uniref:Stage III sporulation protein AH n=1 Tax=Parageobacillus thermoglucosidasius TaxID=1426 RepID=A0A1B7KX55_PARTM|nr:MULTISPECIES: SpoIIIAH-like family protein [Parageobacillus]OAT74617.1 stage III sporulation protein AH [Parageobacillus thermoglucosidasius]BDG46570.1 stage III sporulation protein AH [Parageobacillus sp. KH3-4]